MPRNKYITTAVVLGIVGLLVAGIFLLNGDDDKAATRQDPTSTLTLTPSPSNTPAPSPTLPPQGYSGLSPVLSNDEWIPRPRVDVINDTTFTMVLVPTGCFVIGGDPTADETCFDRPFWLAQYETSNEQYGSGGEWDNDKRPRERIVWGSALGFCEAHGGRLPTAAEWEYALRGPDGVMYPWGNEFNGDYVNYDGSRGQATRDVDNYEQNVSWVGAYNMLGNVWEWTSSPDASDDTRRIIRGGGFETKEENLNALTSATNTINTSSSDIGFRCVWDYTE